MTCSYCGSLLQTMLQLHNSNFFPVTVNVLNVTLTNYAGLEVGVATAGILTISSRSTRNVSW